MKTFAALLASFALVLTVAVTTGSATATPPGPSTAVAPAPPPPSQPGTGRPLVAAATGPTAIWYQYYGAGYGNAEPAVYSNRNPTWVKGTNPHLIFQPDRNLVIYVGSVAIWASNTAGIPNPGHFVMQRDGNAVIYGANGAAYWATHTNNGYYQFVISFWTNGCMTVHSQYYGWHRIWQSSASSICNIDIS